MHMPVQQHNGAARHRRTGDCEGPLKRGNAWHYAWHLIRRRSVRQHKPRDASITAVPFTPKHQHLILLYNRRYSQTLYLFLMNTEK